MGISSEILLNMMKKLKELKYINSIIILRSGHSVLESWQYPYQRETPHQLFSLSKSFTSCAIGLAQAEGLLKITDKLITFFPEYAGCVTDKRMLEVSLKDLLTMRSGHLVCATKYMFGQQDYIKAFLSSPLDTEPGTHFTYNSGATYMLSAVIRKVAKENVREYLTPRLFNPLQIVPGIWECCPQGINCGGWGLSLTTDDLAKFSYLLLKRGKWNGKQIIPEDYLAEAASKHADNSMNKLPDWQQGYGYQFWISRHGYRGDGAAGQLALVLEEYDLCISMTSCLSDMQKILNIFWEELIPYLKPHPLPENTLAQRKLQEYTNEFKIQPPENSIVKKAVNVCFQFEENSAGIQKCEVISNENLCALTFYTVNGIEQLRAGFGHFEFSVIQLTDTRPHPVAAFAVWEDADVLKISSFICDGIYRDIWTIDFSNPEKPVKHEALCCSLRPLKPEFVLSSAKNGFSGMFAYNNSGCCKL